MGVKSAKKSNTDKTHSNGNMKLVVCYFHPIVYIQFLKKFIKIVVIFILQVEKKEIMKQYLILPQEILMIFLMLELIKSRSLLIYLKILKIILPVNFYIIIANLLLLLTFFHQ